MLQNQGAFESQSNEINQICEDIQNSLLKINTLTNRLTDAWNTASDKNELCTQIKDDLTTADKNFQKIAQGGLSGIILVIVIISLIVLILGLSILCIYINSVASIATSIILILLDGFLINHVCKIHPFYLKNKPTGFEQLISNMAEVPKFVQQWQKEYSSDRQDAVYDLKHLHFHLTKFIENVETILSKIK